MKIVFMGTPDFAVPSLHALTEAGYAVAAVVTQPDKPKGRGKTLLPTPVKEEAVMHDIPVYQPEKVRNKGGSLFGKLAQAGADLLIKTLPSIEQGTAEFEKQPEESPTPYAAMITKQMGLMDFRKSAEELERLVRGLNPWPSAYTFLNGKTLKVWKCKVSTEKTDAVPGTIFLADKEGIHTACGEGVLILTEVQLEGKKRMETEAFLRGYHIENGIVFTDHKE